MMAHHLGLLLLLLTALGASPALALFDMKEEASAKEPLLIHATLPAGGRLQLLLHPGQTVGLVEGDRTTVHVLHRITGAGAKAAALLRVASDRPEVVRVVERPNATLSAADSADRALWAAPGNASWTNLSALVNASRSAWRVELEGVFLGRAFLRLELFNATSGGWSPLPAPHYPVSVIRRLRFIDRIFTVVVICLVTIGNLGMGTKLELRVVKAVLKRPLAPVIGFCCQYTIMPLIAFGVGTLLKLPPNILLGYFAMGCAPGGGGSNFFTYLLGGDVSLSVTMTLISTLAALGMVPLWLFTLGQHIIRNRPHAVKIPFQNIVISLVTMLVPIAIGYLIKKKLPRVAKVINYAMKPFIFLLMLFFFTVGIYANLYIFRLFTPIVIIAGCLLPYGGFFLGGLVAAIARLGFKWVKTVAIETGIQNPGVPILLLKFSLPRPDSYISIVGPIAASMFTPAPLFIAFIVREIYLRCCKKKKPEEEEELDEDETKDEVETKDKKDGAFDFDTKETLPLRAVDGMGVVDEPEKEPLADNTKKV